MNTRRVTDTTDRSVFRSDRFFFSQGKWFFTTRETAPMGPYDRRPQAEQALDDYLAAKTGRPPGGWAAPGATH